MNIFLLSLFVLIILLFSLIVVFSLRLLKVEKKNIDFSYNDVLVLLERFKELLVESERISEKLDNSIKEKEHMLEDLCSLIEMKMIRLEKISEFSMSEKKIKDKIIEFAHLNKPSLEIANELGISTAEVDMVLNFFGNS